MKRFLLVALLALSTLACTSKENAAAPQANADLRKDYESGWYSLVTLNNAGTRSEGKTFQLFHGTLEVPYQFETIYAGGQGFRFAAKANLWDSAGYVPVQDITREMSQESVAKAELDKGFYYGKSWKQGTPEHWFIATRGDVSAVIDPEKLKEFLWQYDWKPFPLTKAEILQVAP